MVHIFADYRERSSGIPDLLTKKGATVDICELKSGDYLINRQILIERKTNQDFIQSLISNRLFHQCQGMKKSSDYQLIIIEGNPYNTHHKINKQAIRGAMLSVLVSWQIPVLITANKQETTEMLIMTGNQVIKGVTPVIRSGYKPKRYKNRQLFFLQGLPDTGPVLAARLLQKFGSIEAVIHASQSELIEIEGIGNGRAKKILQFIKKSL